MLPFQRQPIAAALTLMLLSGAIPAEAGEDTVTRGEYLVRAGGCLSCHTVAGGEKLAEAGRSLPRLAPSTVSGSVGFPGSYRPQLARRVAHAQLSSRATSPRSVRLPLDRR
jgi:mono/diheme cytochrome c family protein